MERQTFSKENTTLATANTLYGFTVSSLVAQPKAWLADHSDRPSSMETHKPDRRPVSRLAASNGKARNVGGPDIRSMEEVMAGTADAEDETVSLKNHLNAADKQASNDVFDYPDSDRDVAREDTRIPSPVCYLSTQACNRL